MSELTIGSLFAGIGGLELGLEWAGVGRTVWQVEIDPYCQRVLEKHWPDAIRYSDITEMDWRTVERPDVICGGYPCPAFSQAARGRNNAPDLWPYMREAVGTLRPRFVVLENVAAHLGRGFGCVLDDLCALGFDAEWGVLSACTVGAPHPRRRLFAIAYPHRDSEPTRTLNGEMAWLCPPASDSRDRWLPTADDVGTDDGIPYRVDRVRALGNAVVPQVAQLVGERLMELAA